MTRQVDAQKWIEDEANRKFVIPPSLPIQLFVKILHNKELEIIGNLKIKEEWDTGVYWNDKNASVKLEKVSLVNLKINNVDLSQLSKLQYLEINLCPLLTSVNFLCPLPSPEIMISLDISNNGFTSDNLDFLKNFVNLFRLCIGNYPFRDGWLTNCKENGEYKYYNKLQGSLESLKNLTSLLVLDIRDTDIDSGYEHLPGSVTVFECGPNKRGDAKVEKLYQLYQLHLDQKRVAKKKVIEIPPSTSSTSSTPLKNNKSNEVHFFWWLLIITAVSFLVFLFFYKKSKKSDKK